MKNESSTTIKLTDGFTSQGMQLIVLREALNLLEKKTEKALMEAKKYWTCAKHEHRINAIAEAKRSVAYPKYQ